MVPAREDRVTASCPTMAKVTVSPGGVTHKPRGSCEYLQSRRGTLDSEKFKDGKDLGVAEFVPVGKPVNIGKRWIDIKHCCVSPCISSSLDLARLVLSEDKTGSRMTHDEILANDDVSRKAERSHGGQCEEESLDATGRTSGPNGCNQRKFGCSETAEDIFSRTASGDHCGEATGEQDPDNNADSVIGTPLREARTLCNAPVIDSLQDLVAELHQIFAEDHVDVEYVEFIMSSYKSKPAEWKKYAKFDKFKYTRNLVDAGNDKFNLMILCWGEGHGSSVHDHADAHCFMKMLDGSLTETRFQWPTTKEEEEQPLRVMGKSLLNQNEVCYINDSLGLHRVENSSYSEKAVSLHLYSPPFDACSVFNERTGHKTKSLVTFWSKFGKRDKKKTSVGGEAERVQDMEDN